MTLTWRLRSDSEEATIRRGGAPEQSSYKKVWLVGVEQDPNALHSEVSNYLDGTGGQIPGKFGPYYFNFDSYTAKHLGNGYWEVEATYVTAGGGSQPDGGGGGGGPQPIGVITNISFDTSGGTQHITSALDERRFAALGGVAPDMKQAIGVNGDNVDGVDIVVPVFEWSEDYEIAGGDLTMAFARDVASLTGKVNDADFRGFARGEVLFLGCSGSQIYNPNQQSFAEASVAKVSFRFARKPNKEIGDMPPIGGIQPGRKEGWEYLWIRYDDAVRDDIGLKTPAAVYINRVYEYGDFSLLRLP